MRGLHTSAHSYRAMNTMVVAACETIVLYTHAHRVIHRGIVIYVVIHNAMNLHSSMPSNI